MIFDRPLRLSTWATMSAIAALTLVASASPAQAYVRTTAKKTGKPLYWPRPCVRMDLLLGSAPQGGEELFRSAANEAAAVWSSSRVACTKVFMTISGALGESRYIENDKVNAVQFLHEFWGRNAREPVDRVPYPRQALAITSVWASSESGTMVDTDVELNATGPQWADVVKNPELLRSNNVHDLQNTLTHEFGHVMGLDHTCDGGGQSNGFDHNGDPVQPCPGPLSVQETTMAAIVEPGDSKRRTLSPDDELAMCEIYPADGKSVCSDDPGGGCAVAGAGRNRPLPYPLLALLASTSAALAWVRRRRKG